MNIVDKKTKSNSLSFTVGIPTYYGGPAIVRAAKSILASEDVKNFRFIVTVDGNPLEPDIFRQLKELGVEVINNEKRGGQTERIKQLISLADSDILILTQDDIQFKPDALARIVEVFNDNPGVTMVGAKVIPSPAETFFESIIEVGVRLNYRIATALKNGDNYLLSSGRCLAFRSGWAKKFDIPEEIINSDAYFYFENKRKGGVFRYAPNAIVYNKSPLRLREHLKQSKKFEYSKTELQKYFNFDLSPEYALPVGVAASAYFRELATRPILTVLYTIIFMYTKMKKNMYKNARRFWSTDVSTKR